jgi:hypothetical protein
MADDVAIRRSGSAVRATALCASLVAILTSAGVAVAQSPAPAPAGSGAAVVVTLTPQNGSGESGTATLTQSGPDIIVVTHINGAGTTPQPIHIHVGTCAKLDPQPKYPLTTVQNGASTTTLKDMKTSQLQTGDYAINVHKSTTDIATYVSCGNIPKAG